MRGAADEHLERHQQQQEPVAADRVCGAAQQRERLMGGKAKKSVLDLWIKSQKYEKRSNQPQIDNRFFAKFRADNYGPAELETAGGPAHPHQQSLSHNLDVNPLLLDADCDSDKQDVFDPYGHYQAVGGAARAAQAAGLCGAGLVARV